MTSPLQNRKYVAQAGYDFAKDGGAVGDITLRGLSLPAGAVVDIGKLDVQTSLTSGGAATAALKLVNAADVLAETAMAGLAAGVKDLVPDGTAANTVKTTANTKLVLTVGTAALTAGKFVVCLEYYITD